MDCGQSCTMMFNQRWIAGEVVQTRKSKYDDSLHKGRYNGSLGNCKEGTLLRTIDGRRIKYRFGLVVKLIANKYYIDLFCYLSFLPPAIRLLSFTVQIFDMLLTLDQYPGSIGKPNCWII